MQCAGGDFGEGVFGNEAERSWHTGLSATDGEKLLRPKSGQRRPRTCERLDLLVLLHLAASKLWHHPGGAISWLRTVNHHGNVMAWIEVVAPVVPLNPLNKYTVLPNVAEPAQPTG